MPKTALLLSLMRFQTMWRNMYQKYPHQRVTDAIPDRDGTTIQTQDLQLRMTLGVRKSDKKEAASELSDFSPPQLERLSKLSYGPNHT
jgi:hypothetical protein